jgi:hypothetical protein
LVGTTSYGTCGPYLAENYVRLVTTALAGSTVEPTWEDIRALYVRQNPDFDERTGAGDDGVDMKTMLTDAVKHGFTKDVKVLGFAEVDVNNPEEVQAVVAIFGGTLLGLDLKQAQNQQLQTGIWDYVPNTPEWGGHAVCEGAYESDEDENVITWAQRVSMTRNFVVRQRQEAYVVILDTHLRSRQFMAGWDLAAFAKAYTDITGRPFPVDLPDAPAPERHPDDVLADAVRAWAFKRHSGLAKVVADALKAWLRATGRA